AFRGRGRHQPGGSPVFFSDGREAIQASLQKAENTSGQVFGRLLYSLAPASTHLADVGPFKLREFGSGASRGFRVEPKNDEVLTFRGARSSGMRSAGRFAVRSRAADVVHR